MRNGNDLMRAAAHQRGVILIASAAATISLLPLMFREASRLELGIGAQLAARLLVGTFALILWNRSFQSPSRDAFHFDPARRGLAALTTASTSRAVRSPTTTETVIAAALRSGNLRRAVELLLDSYQEELFAYCDRLVGTDRAAAVYGRVLALALDDMQSVARAASLRAWLFRLARGIVLQVHRTSPRLFPLALNEGYVPVAGPAVEAFVGAALAGGQQELGRLEPRALEVLQLSLWHGLLLFEVAEVVERSESEVRRLAAQGLGRLALQSDRPGPPS